MLDKQTNEVFCLDSEGAPLKLHKKKDDDVSQGNGLVLDK
jgi:hypothetical protein